MGEIAEMMLGGVMCEMCGTPLECEDCESMGIPMYCSIECAKDRGADKAQVCNHFNNSEYTPRVQSYMEWMPVLVERLKPYGVEIKKITEWQYRINGTLDLYPVNRKWHDIKKNKRGEYRDFVSFTIKYFKLKKHEVQP